MLRLPEPDAILLRETVWRLARQAPIDNTFADLTALYADLADRVARRRPVCNQSGACCRFDAYGHLLFVTTLELALFVHSLGEAAQPTDAPAPDWSGCPFQLQGLCSVHPIRPMGCRIFFCDPTSQAWQQDLYESLHHQIRTLHDQAKIPYFFVEWRAALRAVGLATPPASQPPQPHVTSTRIALTVRGQG